MVWGLDLSDTEHRRVLAAHRWLNPDTPLLFFTNESHAPLESHETGCRPRALSVSAQVSAVKAAITRAWSRDGHATPIRITGPVSSMERAYAQRRLTTVNRVDPATARLVEIELVRETGRSWERPALARATLELDGRRVFVHADSTTMFATIDLLFHRARDRIESRT